MTVNVYKVVAVALASLSSRVSAFSTLGAGSCGAGDTSINNAVVGNIHITGTTGPLADAGVTFSVNGAALTAGSTTTVTAGTDLAWSVDSSGTGYEGVFVRIESAAAFTLEGDPTFVDTAAMCASIANVQGVDHFNKDLKTSVTGTTVFDEAGTATVDVTIVLSLTQWAHSTFSLTIEGATADTPAPVDGTTPAPVDGTTPAPVDGTTPAPVDGTTPAPTPSIDSTPAPTPPVDSTPAPTPVTVPSPVTDAPTDGECPEGKGKKGKKGKSDDTGKGMGMKDGKMMKCKKEKTPKEPKTPKAGKGKGDDDDASVRRRK